MNLNEIVTTGRVLKPPRMIVYGPEKIGKTTLVAGYPNVVFLPIEEGSEDHDVARLPRPRTFTDALRYLGALYTQEHSYKAVAIDTIDELQSLIFAEICKENGKSNIEEFGYGKGFTTYAPLKWRKFLKTLDMLRNDRGIASFLICHSHVKTHTPPDSEPYDRYELQVNKHAVDLLKHWADVIGFATFKTFVTKDDLGFDKKHTRVLDGSQRVLKLGKHPGHEGGNRWGLPDEIDLNWNALSETFKQRAAGAQVLELKANG